MYGYKSYAWLENCLLPQCIFLLHEIFKKNFKEFLFYDVSLSHECIKEMNSTEGSFKTIKLRFKLT